MTGRGERRCIRGITSSWPAAAAFQAAVVFVLPPLCQPSPNCASARLHGGGGCWQRREVVSVVSAAAGADAPLGLSAAGVFGLWP